MTSPLPLTLDAAPLAVATTGLTKWFGDVDALLDVTLQVPEGSVYLLGGPNVAGKTTLLKVLHGAPISGAGSSRLLSGVCSPRGPSPSPSGAISTAESPFRLTPRRPPGATRYS